MSVEDQIQYNFGANGKCSICQLPDIDSLNYGEIHGRKELTVHLFCLYFSTHLPQRGQDSAGICGFEFRDIRKLMQNFEFVKCCYCGIGSATTFCHFPGCGRVFHQVCGFKANARFEYLESFRSFCDDHNSIENENLEYPEVNGCWICYEALGDYHPVTTVPSCCGLWFHQQCLRKYAINAGYSFMCPLCRNKDFGDFARRHGIYVPEYEALWEKTHDYSDIERFYTKCDAESCVCPKGRMFSNRKWQLQLCSCCGSFGFHRLCRAVGERDDVIICNICINVVKPRCVSPLLAVDDTIASEQNLQIKPIELDNGLSTLERNISSMNYVPETLEEKRRREKAERPLRDQMRDFRISLWFRDYKRYATI